MAHRKKPPVSVKSTVELTLEVVDNLQQAILINEEEELGQYFDDQIAAGAALLLTGNATSAFVPKTPSRKAPIMTRNRLQGKENLASKAEFATKLLFEDQTVSSEPTTSPENTRTRRGRQASKAASNKIKNTLQFERSTAKLRRPDDASVVGNIAETLNGTINLDEPSWKPRKLRTRRKNKVLPVSSEEEEDTNQVKEDISTRPDKIIIMPSPQAKKRSSQQKIVTTSLAGQEVSESAFNPETEKGGKAGENCKPNIIGVGSTEVQVNRHESDIAGRSSRGDSGGSAIVKTSVTPVSLKNPANYYDSSADSQVSDEGSGKRSSNKNTKCSDIIKSENSISSVDKTRSLVREFGSPATSRRSKRLIDAESIPAESSSIQESIKGSQLRKDQENEAETLTNVRVDEDVPRKSLELGSGTETRVLRERSGKEWAGPVTSHSVASKHLDLNGEIRSPTPDSGFHSSSGLLTNRAKERSKAKITEADKSPKVSRIKPVVMVTESSLAEPSGEEIDLCVVRDSEDTLGSVVVGDSPFLSNGLKKTKTKIISKLHKKQASDVEESPNTGLQYVAGTPMTSDQCYYVESSDESLFVAKKSSKEMVPPQKKRTRIMKKTANKEDRDHVEHGEEKDGKEDAPLAAGSSDVEGLKAEISTFESHTEVKRTRVQKKKETEVVDEGVIDEKKHQGVNVIEELLQQVGNVPPKPRTRKVQRKNEVCRVCETTSVSEVSVLRMEDSMFILPKTPPRARTRKMVPKKEQEGRMRTRLKQNQTTITEEAEEPSAAEKTGNEYTVAQPDKDPIKTVTDKDVAEPNRTRTRRIQRKEAESTNEPSVVPPAIDVVEDDVVEMPRKRTRVIQKTTQPNTEEITSSTSCNVQPVFDGKGTEAVEAVSLKSTRTRNMQESNAATECVTNFGAETNAQFDGKSDPCDEISQAAIPNSVRTETVQSSRVAMHEALISNAVVVLENLEHLIGEKSCQPDKPSEDAVPTRIRTRKIQKKNVDESKDNTSKAEGMKWEESQPISGTIEEEAKTRQTRTRQKKQELFTFEDNPGTRTRVLTKQSAYKPPEIDTGTEATKMPLAVQSPIRNVKSPREMLAKAAARAFTPKQVFSPFRQLSVKEKASAFESGRREEEDDLAEEGNRTINKGAAVGQGTKRKSAVSHVEEPTVKRLRTPSPKKYPARGPVLSVSSASSFSSSGSGKGPTRLARLPFLSSGKSKHGNIATGVKSFLPSNRQPPKPSEGELKKKKEEELRAKELKELEIKRKKEEEIRRKAEENKRKREQKMKEVMIRREMMKQEGKDEKVQKFMAQTKQKAAELEQKNAEIRKQKELEEKRKFEEKMKSQKTKDTPVQQIGQPKKLPPSALKKNLDVTYDRDSPLSDSLTPKKKVGFQSNPDNYGIDDLDSGDETDDDTRPKKTVPEWAKGRKLKEQLLKQSLSAPDLKSVFPPEELLILPPDLSKIFPVAKKRFHKRTSSAIWDTPPGNISLNASRR
ncbi:axoneme-associated protein mst101(2)-like isoform X2 [Artemia franciscana]|uniref:Inner centromere protein ARK-binding domain-containing protein n=1 Tax=Artemia franciscana TaxID=6661 RepID=A0AA88HM34_ARTSF|nr:hypothetical protein QYM36_009524 [Artemia franciscana]